MAITKEKKADIIKDLEDKFGKAKAVVWTHYSGLSVKDMTELRKGLREEGVDFRIAKKTLVKRAAESQGLKEIPAEFDEGASGLAFSYEDEIAPAKLLFNFGKTHEQIKLLGAWVDGKFYSKEEAIALAKIPGKQELLSKLVYLFNSPLSGFVGVGHGLLSKFVRTLAALEEQKAKS